MPENQQRIVRFEGNVQGVGFRYAACRAAAGYDLTGYVRNLSDGAVECAVEGSPTEIDAFLADLAGRMHGFIRKQMQQSAPPTGQFAGFGVRY